MKPHKTSPHCARFCQRLLAGLTVLALVSGSSSQAALLVYEGFDGYTTGSITGKNVSANTIGLSGSWQTSGSPPHQVIETGLTFNGLVTRGGALSFSSSVTRLTGVALTPSLAAGATLYSSYLVNLSTLGSGDSGVGTRIHPSSATGSGGTGGAYFSSFADTRPSANPAIAYSDKFDPDNTITGSSALKENETFLIISIFTNVGGTGTGNAYLYALNQNQFTHLLAVTDLETYLSSTSVGQGDTQIWATAQDLNVSVGSYSFNSSDYFQILSLGGTLGVIDEIRYGTTLADVLSVPEPSRMLLAGLGLFGVLMCHRR